MGRTDGYRGLLGIPAARVAMNLAPALAAAQGLGGSGGLGGADLSSCGALFRNMWLWLKKPEFENGLPW